ncbi:MAG TPA: alternative ribosome rescue aminoacyl-tRNA hydrolase ArfB [Planctomycetaceae bacterium]|nr:alternative ribosome rescue aminoacyl-tRNA hydrolase ArfB [Planctomycetaceae bacterium]
MAGDSKEDLIVSERVRIAAGEFEWSFARSGGPGGQNVNKVNSKAILRWRPADSPSLPDDVRQRFLTRFASKLTEDGDLVIASDEYRDQPKNVTSSLEKLRQMIQQVLVAPRKRKATKPSLGSKRRRLENKQRQSEKKQGRRPPME